MQESIFEDDSCTAADRLRPLASEAITEFTARFAAVLASLSEETDYPVVADMYAAAGMLDWSFAAISKESVFDRSLLDFAAYVWGRDQEKVNRLSLEELEDAVIAAISDLKSLEVGVPDFSRRLWADMETAVKDYREAYRDAVQSDESDDFFDQLLILRDNLEFAMLFLQGRTLLKDIPFELDLSMLLQQVRLIDLKLRVNLSELAKKLNHVDLPIASPETFWWRRGSSFPYI